MQFQQDLSLPVSSWVPCVRRRKIQSQQVGPTSSTRSSSRWSLVLPYYLCICSLTAFCVLALPSPHSLTFRSECDDVLMLFALEFILAELAVVLPGQWRGRRPGARRPSSRSMQSRLWLPLDQHCSGAVGSCSSSWACCHLRALFVSWCDDLTISENLEGSTSNPNRTGRGPVFAPRQDPLPPLPPVQDEALSSP